MKGVGQCAIIGNAALLKYLKFLIILPCLAVKTMHRETLDTLL